MVLIFLEEDEEVSFGGVIFVILLFWCCNKVERMWLVYIECCWDVMSLLILLRLVEGD